MEKKTLFVALLIRGYIVVNEHNHRIAFITRENGQHTSADIIDGSVGVGFCDISRNVGVEGSILLLVGIGVLMSGDDTDVVRAA